jgi:Putative nucleotidyltransferase DUF294
VDHGGLRSETGLNEGIEGSLDELADNAGVEFPQLSEARGRTESRLAELRDRLSATEVRDDVALCMMGSWGRRELTRQSDDDWLILVEHGEPPESFLTDVQACLGVGERAPGKQNVFGTWTPAAPLVSQIGLDQDDNTNLTRRVLLILESVPLVNATAYEAARDAILRGYLDPPPRDRHVPRFFLNDVVRYWRTVCVDFVGKERERGGESWGLRNAKLRNSRKILFASGLLPILLCAGRSAHDIGLFLAGHFAAPPTDRIAYAFLECDAVDAGARTLLAYDAFLALLDDPERRQVLKALRREDAASNETYQEARRLGSSIQDGLTALLFETEPLQAVTRQYGIF